MDKYIKLEKAKKLLAASNTPSLEKVVISDYLNAWAIEASEDCVDRYSVLAELDPRSYEYKVVKNLPSVVPKEKVDKSLKKQLKDIKTVGTIATEEEYGLFGCRFRTVKHAPSVVPQPKEGEWISKHNGYWTCSECGLSFLFYAKGNYCPNCGSKMKGAEDYERATEQMEHDALYEPTYNSEDGSM